MLRNESSVHCASRQKIKFSFLERKQDVHAASQVYHVLLVMLFSCLHGDESFTLFTLILSLLNPPSFSGDTFRKVRNSPESLHLLLPANLSSTLHWFPIAIVTHEYKWNLLEQKMSCYSAGSPKSKISLIGLRSRCQQCYLPFGGSSGESFFFLSSISQKVLYS